MNVVTSLSLVSGIAGLDLGLRLAIPGIRVLGYVEREAYAAAVLLARMEDKSLEPAPIFCGNLEDFDARPFAGVDILTAGLPCQPYSVAGQQKGHDDERAIWPEFIRIVTECRPSVVFLENVPTFVTGGWFRRPGEELSRLGYEIAPPLFLAAEDVGAPHIRERVWILAYRAGIRLNGYSEIRSISSKSKDERRLCKSPRSCEELAYAPSVQLSGITCAGASEARHCGEALAYRDGARANAFTAPSGSRGAVGECCGELAHAECAERRQGYGSCGAQGADADSRREESPRGAGVGCEELADGNKRRCQSERCGGLLDSEREARRDDVDGCGGEELGHAKQHNGRQGQVQPVAIQPPYPWPPGPGDWERWAGVEEALKPAVRLMADGAPDWMDFARYPTEQLRCLGNAVVPVVAAVAFRILIEEAGLTNA